MNTTPSDRALSTKRTRAMKKATTAAVGCVAMLGILTPSTAFGQTTGQQTFTRVLRGNLSEDQPRVSRVVATGVLNAGGTEQFDPDVPGDPASRQSFVFRAGTISTRTFDEEVDVSIDPRTCVGTLTVTGQEEVVGGSGAFEGAGGSGTLTESGRLFAARNPDGTCNEDDLSYVIVVRYTGTLTLP